MKMKNNWPMTVDELIEECKRLEGKYDLYTLGKRGEPLLGEVEPRVDGTDYLAGEYQYGVAMIPAQWVTSILSATVGVGTCHLEECEHEREIPYDLPECDGGWYTEVTHDCDECGYENIDPNVRFCGGCGRRVVSE